jgi:hypothetical protein
MYKFSKSCENVSFPGSSNAVEGVNKLGSFITFELSDRFNTKSDQPKNAFDVLVNTAVTLKYSQKIGRNPEECRTLYICKQQIASNNLITRK